MLAGLGETIDTGRDTKVPMVPHYQSKEGVFSGRIDRIIVQLR